MSIHYKSSPIGRILIITGENMSHIRSSIKVNINVTTYNFPLAVQKQNKNRRRHPSTILN